MHLHAEWNTFHAKIIQKVERTHPTLRRVPNNHTLSRITDVCGTELESCIIIIEDAKVSERSVNSSSATLFGALQKLYAGA